jgi:hypothetical protein
VLVDGSNGGARSVLKPPLGFNRFRWGLPKPPAEVKSRAQL